MNKGEWLGATCALAALYLRGAPRLSSPARRAWPRVLATLRAHAPGLGQVTDVLARAGHWHEAALLGDKGLLDWAVARVMAQEVGTVLDDGYPVGWCRALGTGAPPAVWRAGPWPGDLVGAVGSRQLEADEHAWAQGVGAGVARMGRGLVTGGAPGADRVALDAFLSAGGQGRALVLLPCGWGTWEVSAGVCTVALEAPGRPFSTAAAMERNALIYAAASHTLVVAARTGVGGTWAGATDALRRRLGVLGVRGQGSTALALMHLGAHALPPDAMAITDALPGFLAVRAAPSQPQLYGWGQVQETGVAWGRAGEPVGFGS
jgi:hypothetical protein